MTVFRRNVGWTLVPIVLAVATSFALPSPPPFAMAQANMATPETPAFVGAWQLTFETPTGPSQSLLTVMADGTLLFSGQAVKPASESAPVTFISAAHGAWEESGDTAANMTWVGMVSDGEGNLLAVVTDSVQAALSADGNAWEGVYQASVADAQGNVLFAGDGTVQATRIAVQLPTATPASG